MITKEKIKKEIDRIPEDQLEDVYNYIRQNIQSKTRSKRELAAFHLKGWFDDKNIRKEAYE